MQRNPRSVKRVVRSLIQEIVNRAPWGVRDAILEACFNRFGLDEISARLLPRLGIVEVGVWGNLGLIRSAWNDRMGLAMYGQTGAVESGIVSEILAYLEGESGTYIDVGANIGFTTIPIAKKTTIRCIAIEPEPSNFRFLKLNVEANAENSNVEFYQNAIFDRRTTVSLAIADGNLGDHRLTMDGIPGRRTIEIPAIPLDDVLDRVTGKLAVKVDTQGAEPFVIAGGKQLFARAGLVAIEFCPHLMRRLGGDPNGVIDFLSGFEQVALSEPGSTDRPLFTCAAGAQETLRAKARTARDSDDDYLDIIARR